MVQYCHVYTGLNYKVNLIKEILYDKIELFKGAKVVIKPNWVREGHVIRKAEWDYIITHPVVIEAVLDIVLEKLEGTGEVIIADCPMAQTDFDELIRRTNIEEIVGRKKGKGTKISIYDLRQERVYMLEGVHLRRKKLPGDPIGSVPINLGKKSEFANRQFRHYYGADYDVDEVRSLHNDNDNIYVLSKTILSSDIFINIPKLKTHRYAGVTAAMKNIVGTVVLKNSMPHHSDGAPEDGGDAYQHKNWDTSFDTKITRIARKLLKSRNPFINYPIIPAKLLYSMVFRHPPGSRIRSGEWYGNDTIWRTIIDLNKIIIYADKEGCMQDRQQRKCYCIVDAIIAGEGNGPLCTDRKECGAILFGNNQVTVDSTAITLMGFDYRKIPSVVKAYSALGWKLTDSDAENIVIKSNDVRFDSKKIMDISLEDTYRFHPHDGWTGHIEMDK